MKALTSVGLSALLLTSCASGGMPDIGMPGMGSREAQAPTETFAYAPATDRNVRAEVESVAIHGEPGFIPSDPNWLQVRLRLTNVGSQTVNFTSVKERIADGSVINSAASASELIKPPNLVREGLTTTGLGVGTMVAGAMLFPPAALIGGAVMAFRPLFKIDQVGRTAERLSREGLRVGPIAPGTSTSGYIFVPAVRGQTGLITFYQVGGEDHSLVIPRSTN